MLCMSNWVFKNEFTRRVDADINNLVIGLQTSVVDQGYTNAKNGDIKFLKNKLILQYVKIED